MEKKTRTSFKLLAASATLASALAGCGGDSGGTSPVFVPVAVQVPGPSAQAEPVAPPAPAPVAPVPPEPSPALGPLFEEQRADMLKQLAPPILNCLPKVDNANPKSPMFHGCVDWHSAVHASYSLYSIYRHTGDKQYLDAVEAVLRPELVQQELAYMTNTQGTTGDRGVFGNTAEDFYGLSWFLALAKERELATGNKDFRPLGEAAAQHIKDLVAKLTPEEIELRTVTVDRSKHGDYMTAHNYANLPWALVHLKLWADWAQDDSLSKFTKDYVATNLMKPEFDKLCPAQNDAGTPDEFFPPCLMRLAAVSRVLGVEKIDWLKERVSDSFFVEPIKVPKGAQYHPTAQNWSRSFALWWIYQTTNQKTLRAMAIRLLGDQLLYRDRWDKQFDYFGYSHWIAQYAVRMIDATYESNAPLNGVEEIPLQLAAGDTWALGGKGLEPDANAYAGLLNKALSLLQGGKIRYVNNAKAVGFDENPASIQNLVEKRLPYLLELIASYQRDPSEKVRSPRLITLHEGYEVGFGFLKPSTKPSNLDQFLVFQEINAIRSTEGDWVVVRAYLQSIVSQLKAAAPKSPIVLGTYDNPYRSCKLAQGGEETRKLVDDYLEGGGKFAKGLNDVIREVARDNGVQVAEIFGKLADEDWSPDCDMPNASGNKKIADAFQGQIRSD
jgi:hypothetical protein